MIRRIINIYSDESHHVNDDCDLMMLGAVWANKEASDLLSKKVKLVKRKHNISVRREIKWTKVSESKIDYYKDLIDLYFDDDNMNYRAVIINKTALDHDRYNQTEDDFYYKMQYILVNYIARIHSADFRIYLDYKDTWSNVKARKLSDILSSKISFFNSTFTAQPIKSYESSPLQLADLITGAIMYSNKQRTGKDSLAKIALTKYLEEKLDQKLTESTPFGITKFNIFFWEPK